jgi:hypothetical protein
MQDVIDKIKDLYDVLEQKSKDIDARTVSLANQKKKLLGWWSNRSSCCWSPMLVSVS